MVVDEVDDFLDRYIHTRENKHTQWMFQCRDKLVFNICSNKPNSFSDLTISHFFEVSKAVYSGDCCPHDLFASSANPGYWGELYDKFREIHSEVQEKSRSINKSFGEYNGFEQCFL